MNPSDWWLYQVRFLPFDMPSRKDSVPVFIKKSAPYVVAGTIVLIVSGWSLPAARLLPAAWFHTLGSLDNWVQILVDGFLSLVLFCSLSYSLGVLIIEKLRPEYRTYIVRPIERQVDYHRQSTS